MQRLITLLVIGLMTCAHFQALAQDVTLSIDPSTVSIDQGDQICLDILADNFTDMVSMQFSINYDPSVVEFDQAMNLNLPGLIPSNIGNPSAGNITVSWLANDLVNGETVSNGTSLFQICFTANMTDGTSDVVFSGNPTFIEFTNASGPTTPIFNDGEIIVGTGGGGSGDLTFELPDVSAANGDQVCLDLTVENFTDMISAQFSINYDDAIVQYDMAQNFNLPGLVASNIGNPSPGNLTLSWLADDLVNGETVSNGTSIVELCFTVIAPSGTSDVSFSGTPTQIECTDANGPLTPVFVAGSIMSTGGAGNSLTFELPDVSAANGDQVCLDLTVQNFTDMISAQFSINYDDAIVQYDMAQNFNLPGLVASNIGNPSPGNLTLSWLADDLVNGESVSNGTSIVELCFTVIAPSGTSDVSFSGTPTSIECTDVDGPVTPVFVAGSIMSTGGAGNSLLFELPDVSAANGDQVCLDLTVQNFTDMISAQFSINYDDAIVQYDMAQNFNLPGLVASNIGNPSPGNLTLSWLADDLVNGETVSNGTSIVELCFTVIAPSGTSDVSFSGTPTSIECTDVDGPLTPVFVAGSIMSTGGAGNSLTFELPDISAANGDQVCLDLTVQNFTSMISAQFSINYDDAIVEYDMAQNFNLPGLVASNIGNPSAGNLTLSWLANDLVNGETVSNGTSIVELCFTVIAPSGTSDVSFSGTPTSIECTDIDGSVTPVFIDGSIAVTGGNGGGGSTDLTFELPGVSGNTGDQVCVDLTVENFTDMISTQFSINYDDAIVEYDMAQNFNLPGLVASNIGNPSAGNLTLSWLANDLVNGETVSNGTSIVELCFTIIGNSGTSDLTFSGTPTSIECTDVDGSVTPVFVDGSIMVAGGGGGGGTDLTFELPDVSGNTGDQVCVDLTVENFTDMISTQFSINYDDAIVEYDMAQNFNLPGLVASNIGNPSAGNLTLSWLANDLVNGETVSNGTSIVELCFTIIGNSGTSDLTFSGTPTSIECTDVDGSVTPVFVDGSIMVAGGGGGGGTDLTFELPDVSGNTGDQVCVDLTVENFTDMISTQFSINYDDAIVEYDMAQNFNLPGLVASNIGNPSAGNLTLSWLANDLVNGETVSNGTSIVELCFTIVGNSGTSDLTFSGTPTSIECTDVDGSVTPVFVDGSIMVAGGGGGGGTDLTFELPDVSGNTGDQVCVDLTVENFTDMISTQFSINYDDAIVEYDMAQNFNLPGLVASNIGNPSAGNLTLSWLANDLVNGETVSNGTSIVELCFTIIGNSGTSDLTFSGTPTSIECTDVDGSVTPVFVDGSITVDGGGGGPSEFLVIAPDLTANAGGQVCVPVSVEGFTNIVSAQFSINYDETILVYTGAQNFNLGGLNASNIGNPSAGNLTFSWSADDPVNGETVSDGTVIVELCFDVIGSNGEVSPINFSGMPTPIEIIDNDGPVTFNDQDGSVTVDGDPPVNGVVFTLPDIVVPPGETVCVPLTVENFVNMISFQFSINFDETILEYTGAQNFNLQGLTAANIGNPSAGNLTISWLSDDLANGTTVANGTPIVELCFMAIGNGGQVSPVETSGMPTPIEVTDVDGDVDFNGVGGSVEIENIIPPDVFAVFLNDQDVQSGDNFCVDVSVQQFIEMISMQFSINFDPAELEFTGVGDINLDGLNASNIGNPSAGNITVSWLSNDLVNGTTVPDGEVIFQLCFTALAPNCSTSLINFSGSPTPIEVTDVDGSVPWASDGALVNICDIIPMEDVTFTASDETVFENGSVCVPITVEGFNDVVSMDFSINYDPAIVSFSSAQNFGLPGFDASDVDDPAAGQITISWDANDPLIGESLADGSVLVELCFDAVGDAGDVSGVDFTGSPLAIEVMDINALMNVMTNDGSITIEEAPCDPPTASGVVTNTCPDETSGSIDLTPADGDGMFTFSWSHGPQTEDVNNLGTGTYTVTVTSCGQNYVETFTIEEFPDITITSSVVGDVDCHGDNTGSVFLSIQGANPFSVTWSGSGNIPNPNQTNLSGVPAGTYSAMITDANGCELTSPVYTIDEPAQAINASVDAIVEPDCAGGSNGSIELDVFGGTPGYSYNWTPALADSPNPSGVAAGTYSVEITDDNGCTFNLNNIQVGEPDPLTIIIDQINNETGAGGNGGVFVSVNGGTPGYSYNWTGPGGPYTTEDINNLEAGTYNLTVTDNNGCQTTTSAEVIKPLTVVVDSTFNSCYQAFSGAIYVSISGGQGPYSTIWVGNNNVFVTEDLTDIAGATYTLTVTDSNSDQVTISVDITEPLQPFEITSSTVVNPTGPLTCDGAIIINGLSGGSFPYQFEWSNGSSSNNLMGLCPADYSVTITDANGCTVTESFTVEFIPDPLVVDFSTKTNVLCNGDSTGTWTVAIEGGVPNYQFAFSNGVNQTSLDGEVTLNDLPAGAYQVTITDNSVPPQEVIQSVTITQTPAISLGTVQIFPETDLGNNGAINITPAGGAPLYDYEWSNGQGTQDPSGLSENCYSVTIVDNNNCVVEFGPFCVPKLAINNTDVTDNFCASDIEGAIDLGITGDINQPLTYSWFDPDGNPMAIDTNAIDGLPSGVFTVIVTDALGVSTPPMQINVGFNSDVVLDAGVMTNNSGFGVSCAGAEDAVIVATATDGQAPYSFQWSGGLGTDPVVEDVGVGTYSVVVIDDLGCLDSTTVTVTGPEPVQVINANVQSETCAGDMDATIQLMVSGGVAGYEYAWDDPLNQVTNPAIELPGGTYTVTITDVNDCTTEASFEVVPLQELQISLTSTPDEGNDDGTIIANVQGGTQPYDFTWNNGMDDPEITGLDAGEYSLMVTDANGCTAISRIMVANGQIDCLEYSNVITPFNQDGMNDFFIINCASEFPTTVLYVYTRWGQLVYEEQDFGDAGWDGTDLSGQQLEEGAYYFIFDYLDTDGQMKQLKGHITILE
jgi:gliding motility-associated-like protein